MADTPPDPHTQDVLMIAKGFIGPVISAFFGLVVRWGDDYRRTHRWAWKRVLVEMPATVGLGIIGGSVATYMHATPEVGWGIAALLGNLGTRGFFDTIARLIYRRK